MLKSIRISNERGARLLKWSAILLAALLPALLTFVLLQNHLRVTLADFYPVRYLDQSDYWHEAFTFKDAGLNGGYYGVDERVTPLSGLRFGTHGPLYPLLYGFLARFSGWDFTTPVYLNMAILGLGVLGFSGLAKLRPHQAMLLALLMLTFTPLVLYVPTILQESMQQAAALVLAGIFAVLFERGAALSRMQKGAFFTFLFLISVARFSWGVLFLPFLVLAWPGLASGRPVWQRASLYIGISGALLVLVYIISWLVTAPGADTIVMTVDTLRAAPVQGLKLILIWLENNLAELLSSRYSVALVLRLQVFALVLFAGFQLWKTGRRGAHHVDREAYLALFHLINLLPLSLALLTVYFLETDVRVLGPHLLLSLALMIRRSGVRPALAFILFNLVAYPAFLSEVQGLRPAFSYDKARLAQTRTILSQKMPYRAQAPDPWCNTLLISGMYYYETLLSVPPGVGVSFIWPGRTKEIATPLKSAWLILDEEKYARFRRMGNFDPVALATLPSGGVLYRNPLSVCPIR